MRCEAEPDSQEIRLPSLQFQLLHPARKVAYGSGSLAHLASKGLDSERPQQPVGHVFAWEVSFDGGILDGCSGRGNNSTQGQSWPGRARRLSEGQVEGPRRFIGAGELLPSCSLPHGRSSAGLRCGNPGEEKTWFRIFGQRAACASFSGRQAGASGTFKNAAASDGPKGCLLELGEPQKATRTSTDKKNLPGNSPKPLVHLEKATIYHCPTFLKTTKGSEEFPTLNYCFLFDRVSRLNVQNTRKA